MTPTTHQYHLHLASSNPGMKTQTPQLSLIIYSRTTSVILGTSMLMPVLYPPLESLVAPPPVMSTLFSIAASSMSGEGATFGQAPSPKDRLLRLPVSTHTHKPTFLQPLPLN